MKVNHRKLGQYKADGLAWNAEKTIEIDSRAKGKYQLYLYIHEALHILEPEWSEKKVISHAKKLAKLLWDQKYRKVDL